MLLRILWKYKKIAEKRNDDLIERLVEGNEFSFTFVKNELVAIAQRVPDNVIGDGRNNIKT